MKNLFTFAKFWLVFLPKVYSSAKVGLDVSCLSRNRWIKVVFPTFRLPTKSRVVSLCCADNVVEEVFWRFSVWWAIAISHILCLVMMNCEIYNRKYFRFILKAWSAIFFSRFRHANSRLHTYLKTIPRFSKHIDWHWFA